jgi:hypothetical protein
MLYEICKNITEVYICNLLYLLLFVIKIIIPEEIYVLIKLAIAWVVPNF